jgi:uncharacterized membrane protein YoaK (UPF0700 family)
MPGASIHAHSALLSAVAGYVDAAGFTLLVGLFPAHLTGEIVGDAIAFSSGHPKEHAIRFWILPVFIAAVMTATVVARTLRRSGRRALTGLLALVSLALALFSASDGLARLLHGTVHMRLLLGGACAVTAMGFQNALMRESLRGSCPTTVMTGNLTHVVIDIVDHLLSKLTRPNARDRRPTSRLLPTASALLAFIACAVLGGFLTRLFGSLSVVLPAALTATLTFRSWSADHKPRLPSSPLKILAPARLPGFETWPEALSSLPSAVSRTSALDTTSTAAKEPGQGEPEVRTGPHNTKRPPIKRTISGTQLSARARKGD